MIDIDRLTEYGQVVEDRNKWLKKKVKKISNRKI